MSTHIHARPDARDTLLYLNGVSVSFDGFKALRTHAPCPVYALGGIGAGNVADLLGSGACGIAGVDAVQTAFRP